MIVVTTITNAGVVGDVGGEGGAGAGYVGDRRSQSRCRDDDQAGEADRAVDVGG